MTQLPPHFQGKRFLMLGAGKTGMAVVTRMKKLGVEIHLCDQKSIGALPRESQTLLIKLGIPFALDQRSSLPAWPYDVVVLSPGIPFSHPILVEAKKKKSLILGEIELAYQMLPVPIIAVTGTNGKTTTTSLIGEIFRQARLSIEVAGNIGRPFIEIDNDELDFVILEVSSYQLESIHRFSPVTAVLLNMTPDHLARHQDMETYITLKKRIFKNQRPDDFLVYKQDDPILCQMVKEAPSMLIPFSTKEPLTKGVFVKDQHIWLKTQAGEEKLFPQSIIPLPGEHNLENVLAATACALFNQIPLSAIQAAIQTFKGVPHRFECLGWVSGFYWINDSKSTTPESTIVALKTASALYHPICLLLGGQEKDLPLHGLMEAIQRSAKQVLLFGHAAPYFAKALKQLGYERFREVGTLAEAVATSTQVADRGETILLSPACASFDEYTNFEARGDDFKKRVASL